MTHAAKLPTGLSPSSMDLYHQCPRRFEEEKMKGLYSPPGVEALLGTFVHRVLELLMQHPSEERTRDAAKECARLAWPETEAEKDFIRLNLTDEAKLKFRWDGWTSVLNYFEMENPVEVDVVSTEQRLEVIIDGVPLRGIIDRLDRVEGKLVVSDYKGLVLETELATPSGWTTMGEIVVGDEVFGPDGSPCRVGFKSEVHFNPCFLIKFDDGSGLVADHEHRWVVDTDSGQQTLTTTELHRRLLSKGRSDLRIALQEPLKLPKIDLPIDPWMFGYWLGNGRKKGGDITYGDPAVGEVVLNRGYRLGPDTHWKDGTETRTVYGLRTALRLVGVLGSRSIPPEYLRGSFDQRLDFLRGLMDSDGNWNKLRGEAVFVNLDKGLADAVADLVTSLGLKCSRWEGKGSGFGKVVHQYRVSFRPREFNPFLASKADLVTLSSTARGSRHLIREILEIPPVATQCIGVSNDSQMYLAGRSLIPTHNSGKVPDKKYFGPKRDQLNLYAAMINAKEGTIPDVGRLIFTAHSQIIDVEFTPKTVASVEAKTKTVWTEINEQFAAGEVFRPNTGPLCGWCPLVDRCPEGKAFANNLYQRGRLKATAPAYAMFANGTAGKIIAMPRREKRA